MSNLSKRIISASILAPLFLIIIHQGGLLFFFFSLFLFGGMFVEWILMTKSSKMKYLWLISGFIYIGSAFFVFIFLERMRFSFEFLWLEKTPAILFLVILLVWVTDVCAYFFGRTFKGPKIAPKISPNKTWAGLIGGILGCVAVFFILDSFSVSPKTGGEASDQGLDRAYYTMLFIHIIFPIIAQSGDFLESYVKRKFGFKDSSNIIPGHGGLLDRFDGLLSVLFVMGLYFTIMNFNPANI